MKPVRQTEFGANGNCLSTSIASVLETSLDCVPNYVEIYSNSNNLDFPVLAQIESINYGFTITPVFFDGCLDRAKVLAEISKDTNGYFVCIGYTRDLDGVTHANVWNANGFQFDPSPTGENRVNNIEMAYIILRTNPFMEKESKPYQFSLGLNKK